MKKIQKDILFIFLFTLFAFFFFYIGESLLSLSELNIFGMFVFWFVSFAISFYTLKYFIKKWLK